MPKVEDAAPAEPDLLDNAPAPRSASALFGHDEVVAGLVAAFARTPPQAILLEGPRGIGKATLAFRLARALVSTVPGTPLPARLAVDDTGRAAAQIAAGTHPGLLHLARPWDTDKKRFKTELTVDEARRLVPFLGATAADGGWRVVIVDAVDDLNLNAANALLKSLEEPPRRTVFLLIAHVAGRVLPTIRSRCRPVRLRPLAEPPLRAALLHLGADPELAPLAEGSVRRALTLAAAGADVVRTARRLLSPQGMADVRAHHLLADLAAARQEGQFTTVVELMLDAIVARVRDGAGQLALVSLEGYAAAYLEAGEERRQTEIYNLDKREMVLSLAARLAAADRTAREPPSDRSA